MSANPQLKLRIEPALAREAAALFESLGLSTTAAVSAFFAQALKVRGLPFRPDAAAPEESPALAALARRLEKLEAGPAAPRPPADPPAPDETDEEELTPEQKERRKRLIEEAKIRWAKHSGTRKAPTSPHHPDKMPG